MNRNLGMNDLRNILDFYHLKTPNTIHRIKKKANYVIVKHLCDSNCDCQYKYKKLLYVLHKKRIISNQKKIKHNRTKKQKVMFYKRTRVYSPICYFDA